MDLKKAQQLIYAADAMGSVELPGGMFLNHRDHLIFEQKHNWSDCQKGKNIDFSACEHWISDGKFSYVNVHDAQWLIDVLARIVPGKTTLETQEKVYESSLEFYCNLAEYESEHGDESVSDEHEAEFLRLDSLDSNGIRKEYMAYLEKHGHSPEPPVIRPTPAKSPSGPSGL